MSTLLVSSKGQIVLPAATRRRLGLGAGSQLQVSDELDGVRLRVLRSVPITDLSQLAGMVKAPSRGIPRRLEDFDPATLLSRSKLAKLNKK
jgi:antitoxin PrlF